MFQCLSEFTKRFVVLFVVITVGITACAPNIDRLQRKENVEKLLAALDDDQIDLVRMDAARALGELGAEEAIDPLVRLLSEDDYPGVRSAAAYALGKIGSSSVIQPLINALEDSSSEVKNYAEKALAMCGEAVVDPMIELLGSEEDGSYQSAMDILCEIGDPAVPDLIESLSINDTIHNQRIMEALVKIGELSEVLIDHELSVDLLVDSLDDEARVEDIHSILLTIGEPTIDPLINALSDPNLRLPASEVLMDMEDMVLEPLFEAYEADPDKGEYLLLPLSLGMTSNDIDVRERVMAIFVDIGEAAVPVILDAVKNNNEIMIDAQKIKDFGEPAIPHFMMYLKDAEVTSTSPLFNLIKDALVAMSPSAVPAMVELLGDTDSDVRYKATIILGEMDDESVVEPLIEALEDNVPLVRKGAAFSLAEHQAIEALDPLINLLDDVEFVRDVAIDALHMLGLPAIEKLFEIYHSKDTQNKDVIENALLDLFKANQAAIEQVAAKACLTQGQWNTTEYDPNQSGPHPTVILQATGKLHSLTFDLDIDWLPYTPEQLELVVCLGQPEKKFVEKCNYYSLFTSQYMFSITRYQNEVRVYLRKSYNGKWLYKTTLTGSTPDACPNTADDSMSQIVGSAIDYSPLVSWISSLGIPFSK